MTPGPLGALQAIVVGEGPRDVVVLHGRDMTAADLAPFARSLGVAARFVFAEAPLPGTPRGHRWWRDPEDPAQRAAARAALATVLAALRPAPVLVGFSQGGMLAMDHALHADALPAGLALLSSQRIADAAWEPRLPRLAGLPVLVAHGRADAELPFARGEALCAAARSGGADVTWIPFDGGHEIPLVVWRALKRWLGKMLAACP